MKRSVFIVSILWSLSFFGCSEDAPNNENNDHNQTDTCQGDNCQDECKDGNCQPEQPKATCGNGIVEQGEVCDEGTNPTQGCINCTSVADGWSCTTSGKACNPNCGNGKQDKDEVCDEGKHKTQGCSDDCKSITTGWKCPTFGQACHTPSCGDGIVDVETEQCDDGTYNLPPYASYGIKDDCLANCTWAAYCGDHSVDEGFETCDVGDEGIDPLSEEARNGYGLCTKECRWSRYYCGDKQITNDETCDDGNSKDGDGCSDKCQIEPGYYCQTVGEPCEPFKCGNKRLDQGETCDDGNRNDDDGCSSACQIENGFLCLTPGESCEPITCDSPQGTSCNDGNKIDGDGCSSICQIEPGWICPDGIHCYVTQCGEVSLSETKNVTMVIKRTATDVTPFAN